MKLDAPVKDVWQAWTDPALVLQWFGSDAAGKGIAAKMDVWPGGFFKISFADGDGTEHTCSGKYADVEENSKLSFSWTWRSEPGVESFVTLLLQPDNNQTLMHFEHARLGHDSKHNYLAGWQSTFVKLQRTLALLAGSL